jgi:hypothetical protein
MILDDYNVARNMIKDYINMIFRMYFKEDFELDLVVIVSELSEGESGPDYLNQANHEFETNGPFHMVITDYNVGTIRNDRSELNLYTEGFIEKLLKSGTPFKLFSGSGSSLDGYIERVFKESGTDLNQYRLDKATVSASDVKNLIESAIERAAQLSEVNYESAKSEIESKPKA